ncbi:heavy metal translocating P-type ATPase [Xanthobacter tagetidis]|uniref:P-type Zn(2+) transporter n=1 Tax=Xanthobacter tagetidis TaxID=60216 RepID=A0A3L7A8A7_9HYPH|nr:heavy metal translocating P-type ATPase [Xanthobacter tagetidis]MBB6309322.1 heavy metal translocating P-type ATPase [Xanthobacter tagetidis]RLP76636.1 heavy metal translocating P-type ATPase [Xanthobacter tagetidis]
MHAETSTATANLDPPAAAGGRVLFALAALPLLAGTVLLLGFGRPDAAHVAFVLGTAPVLAALVLEIVRSLKAGQFGLDILAALSMSAALAFGEPLAGNVVALMYAGGQLLEALAQNRARREMTQLVARAPRTALRREGEDLVSRPIAAIGPGDVLLVRHGDAVPVDGRIADGSGLLDQSAITGEAHPVRRGAGETALSGSVNVGPAFDLVALKSARESTYAAIVRLVEAAAGSRAPLVRLADRYALGFLAVSLALAAGAALLSGDPRRALAVLVVATPCPLILAVPVALMAGLSRAAKLGVLVKSGGALEAMARVRALVLDKTGTLTEGRAAIAAIDVADGFDPDEVLRLAASLDQASNHVVAEALVAAARARGLPLSAPQDVAEDGGAGLTGRVEGYTVAIGSGAYVGARASGRLPEVRRSEEDATAMVKVAVDGRLAGRIVLADHMRAEAPAMAAALRAAGVDHIRLASGDRSAAVAALCRRIGADDCAGDLAPEEKVATVTSARAFGPVMMVGDGVNDAPALAAADVGVAMGARGAAASAEVADVVLLVDRLDRLAEGVAAARRALAIARQSVIAGIALSVLGMLAAAFGYLPPVEGALLQEAIDVAVILNALRALLPGAPPRPPQAGTAAHPAGGCAACRSSCP